MAAAQHKAVHANHSIHALAIAQLRALFDAVKRVLGRATKHTKHGQFAQRGNTVITPFAASHHTPVKRQDRRQFAAIKVDLLGEMGSEGGRWIDCHRVSLRTAARKSSARAGQITRFGCNRPHRANCIAHLRRRDDLDLVLPMPKISRDRPLNLASVTKKYDPVARTYCPHPDRIIGSALLPKITLLGHGFALAVLFGFQPVPAFQYGLSKTGGDAECTGLQPATTAFDRVHKFAGGRRIRGQHALMHQNCANGGFSGAGAAIDDFQGDAAL
jgi:hypothetical protein